MAVYDALTSTNTKETQQERFILSREHFLLDTKYIIVSRVDSNIQLHCIVLSVINGNLNAYLKREREI